MVTNVLKDSVRKRDISAIKSAIFSALSFRPSAEQIDEIFKYCFTHGITKEELFVAHDGEVFSENRSDWNEDSYHRQVGKIQNNFSKERVAHIIAMADCLFKEIHQRKAEARERLHDDKDSHTSIYVAIGVIAAALIAFLFLRGNFK